MGDVSNFFAYKIFFLENNIICDKMAKTKGYFVKKYLFLFIVCFLGGIWAKIMFAPFSPVGTIISPCTDKRLFDIFDSRPIEQRYVIANLSGGIGNQMFQYAAAYAYAKEHNKTIVVSNWPVDLIRAFNLYFLCFRKNDTCFYPAMPKGRRKEISAKSSGDQDVSGFLTDPDIIQISGYFQNKRFFKKYAADIRELFTFSEPVPIETEKLKNEIESRNAVSIHIRRTDYIDFKYHLMSDGYYKRAMKYIACRVDKPHFYIFSDDIDWVEKNMKFNYPHTFVKSNRGRDSYWDMYLMGLCKHNIIANSTFSWWGAWLNKHPDKIVIAPNVWGFIRNTPQEMEKIIDEIVPDEWIILSNMPELEKKRSIFHTFAFIADILHKTATQVSRRLEQNKK